MHRRLGLKIGKELTCVLHDCALNDRIECPERLARRPHTIHPELIALLRKSSAAREWMGLPQLLAYRTLHGREGEVPFRRNGQDSPDGTSRPSSMNYALPLVHP